MMLPFFLLTAWRLAALSAELLLLATHAKVLCCLGAPIPASELSTKRFTYFLFDAVSVASWRGVLVWARRATG
jgi:hypothetical protein